VLVDVVVTLVDVVLVLIVVDVLTVVVVLTEVDVVLVEVLTVVVVVVLIELEVEVVLVLVLTLVVVVVLIELEVEVVLVLTLVVVVVLVLVVTDVDVLTVVVVDVDIVVVVVLVVVSPKFSPQLCSSPISLALRVEHAYHAGLTGKRDTVPFTAVDPEPLDASRQMDRRPDERLDRSILRTELHVLVLYDRVDVLARSYIAGHVDRPVVPLRGLSIRMISTPRAYLPVPLNRTL